MVEGPNTPRDVRPIQYKKSGRYKEIAPDQDTLESEDYASQAVTASAADTFVYTVPTTDFNRKFHLRTLIITNRETSDTRYNAYDGTGTTTIVVSGIIVGPSSTIVLTNLRGYHFTTNVNVRMSQFSTGSDVSVGGVLRERMSGEA